MTEWTAEQKKAINTMNKSLLVSAAAGSGKTAVLVERIIKIIVEDKVDIRRLLVVTFTKAAAEEMRIRIYKALRIKLEDQMLEGQRDFLNLQIYHLNDASISTLHSFCLGVIKQYYHLISIDPGMRIGDDTQMAILREKAMESMMEEEYHKRDERFIGLLEAYNNKKTDDYFRSLVEKNHKFIMNRSFPQRWAEEMLSHFYMDIDQFNDSIYYHEYKRNALTCLNAAIGHVNIAWEITKNITNNDKLVQILTEDLSQLEQLRCSLNEGYKIYYYRMNEITFTALRFQCDDAERKEAVVYHRNKAKNILKKMAESISYHPPEQMLEEMVEIAPMMKYLISLVFRYGEIYNEMKSDKGMMDYNDIEHYCLNILFHKEAAEELKSFYEYVFIDEYQDSNEIQDTIISSIMRKDNVFFVGDVKQSIYRFRMADPTLFLAKEREYSHTAPESFQNKITLNQNFRSTEEIIAGINTIFERIMNNYVGEVVYDDNAKLYAGADYPAEGNTKVEFFLINNDDKDMAIDEAREIDHIEGEAHFIANKILQLKEEKIYDPQLRAERKITYADMVILLRTTKRWSDIYYQVLREYGIPVYAESHTGYFDTLEISLMVQLLKVIDNRYQDIPLLSVMRSPFFSFTMDDITEINLEQSDSYLYDKIKLYILKNDNDLSHKLTIMISSLEEWKNQSRFVPIHDFIWKVMMESGYQHFVSAMPGGGQRLANLRMLIDRAREYSETSIKGLFNFIKLVEGIHTTKKDLSSARTAGSIEHTLKIMSIHKSKGLEFPIVFLGGLGKGLNFQDSREKIIMHKDLGICPNYVNLAIRRYCPTIFMTIAKEKMNIETLSEEMRILYVAMTRAKQMLFMVGSTKNADKKINDHWNNPIDNYALSTAKNVLDWIMPVLLQTEKNPIRMEILQLSHVVKEIEKKTYRSENIMKYFSRIERSNTISSEIRSKLEWKYPHSDTCSIPSKISLSDVAQGEHPDMMKHIKVSNVLEVPKFIGLTVTGAQKGTIIHFIMQHLDLGAIRMNRKTMQEEIEKQIERMIAKELIKKEEIQENDIHKIVRFFNNKLGQRVLYAQRIYREKPFNIRRNIFGDGSDQVLMQGVIDCFFAEGSEYVLLDYKSDYYSNTIQENLLLEKYSEQLKLYKEAIEILTRTRVKESYIYLFHKDQVREIKI
ncbi:MAG: helicase-exonuclease AddAB subunit AddA [Eubacteriales bacterium]